MSIFRTKGPRMLLYASIATAAFGVVAFQVAQPDATPQDHSHELRNADGSWKYTNRLVDSTSPYLLQHAHNPVDWHPWGEDAFEAAREQDKPIFLSVGYSTCYWCHVMEREVFENPEIAELMNELFINVKVDREQRPDIDEVYMTATQLMTRRGGWPMSAFLTPDLKPFYAGTYFGPEDRQGRPGFPTVVRAMHEAWTDRRDEVIATADRATAAVRANLSERLERAGTRPLDHEIADSALEQLGRSFDDRWGGFGVAPKFPQGFNYPFLLAVHERTGEPRPLDMAIASLRHMAAGGMYDHVGGGFHRYSTDGQWRVPHFEKMLYNQAQLTIAYLRAYEATGDEAFADVARDILRYIDELMTGPDGQFYSALDAETDATEGAYYAWNREQIEQTLNENELALFDKAFAIAPIPEFRGHMHPDGGALHMRKPITELAAELGTPYADLRDRLDGILAKMKAVRDDRELPGLDDKVIAGWNGMMIGAYAEAGRTLGEPAYTNSARNAASFMLDRLRDDNGDLLRLWRAGVSEQPAFHEDYAFAIRGLTSLYRSTEEQRWLDAATDLADRADKRFWDDDAGGYYFAEATEDLIARSKSPRDGAIPSGNSAMANALIDLAELTKDDRWRGRAEDTLEAFSGIAAAAPAGHLHMVHAVERFLKLPEDGAADVSASAIGLPQIMSDELEAGPTTAGHARISASVEPTLIRKGQVFKVRVVVDIDDGWHINANPASSPELIATAVDIRSELPIQVDRVEYPKSVRLNPSFSPQAIEVYEGEAELMVECRLERGEYADGANLLRVVTVYQACNDHSCAAPATEIIEVPITVRR